ncbi:MAG: family 14 glycosylhydrolase, partial [Phycicoccus sp.]
GTPLGAWAMPDGRFSESVWDETDRLLRASGMRYVVEGHSGAKLRRVLTGEGWLSLLPHALAGGLTIALPPEPRLHGVRRRWLSITARVLPRGVSRLPGTVSAGELGIARVNERVDQSIARTFDLSGAPSSNSWSVRSPGPLTGGVPLGGTYRRENATLGASAAGAAPMVIHQSNTSFSTDHAVFDVPVEVVVELVTDDVGTGHLAPDLLVPTALTPPVLRPGLGVLLGRAGAQLAGLVGRGATRRTTWVYRAAAPTVLADAPLPLPALDTAGVDTASPLLLPEPESLHQAGLAVHTLDPDALGDARDQLLDALSNPHTDAGRWIGRSTTTLSTIRTLLSPEVLAAHLDRLLAGEQIRMPVGTVAPGRTVTLTVSSQVGGLTPIGWVDGTQSNLRLWMDLDTSASIDITERGHGLSGDAGPFTAGASRATRTSTALDPGVLPSDLGIRSQAGPLLLVSAGLVLDAVAELGGNDTRAAASRRIAGRAPVTHGVILALTAEQARRLGLTSGPDAVPGALPASTSEPFEAAPGRVGDPLEVDLPDAGESFGVPGRRFTANVMAPLEVTDWEALPERLAAAKAAGTDAVSVDVWWGKVAVVDDPRGYEWDYYDRLFAAITDAGLKVVPILSLHECGA